MQHSCLYLHSVSAWQYAIYLCTCHFLCRFTQLVLIFDLGVAAPPVVAIFVVVVVAYLTGFSFFFGRSAPNWAGRARAANGTYCRWSCRPTGMIQTTLIIRRSWYSRCRWVIPSEWAYQCVCVCLIEQLQGQLWWQVLLTDSQKFHFPHCSLFLFSWQIRMVHRAGPALVRPACGLIDALRCGWHTVYGDHIQRLVHVNGDWFPEFMRHKSSQYARGKLPTLKY